MRFKVVDSKVKKLSNTIEGTDFDDVMKTVSVKSGKYYKLLKAHCETTNGKSRYHIFTGNKKLVSLERDN